MTDLSTIREAAIEWLVRTNDPEFDRWDEFTAWLEAAPEHADAYHEVAQNEHDMLPLVAAGSAHVATTTPKPFSRRLALVASIAVVIGAGSLVAVPRLAPVRYATAPGQISTVALGGRDELVLNGDTRVALTGWEHRTVELLQGQILLRLHDSGRSKVEVTSGDLHLIDVGTIFEVSRDGSRTRVLVSAGKVIADPRGAHLTIDAGQRLSTSDGAVQLTAVPAGSTQAGAFVAGQLDYLEEPIANVAADLGRSTGVDFSVDPAIGSRRFSGTLSVTAVKRDPQSLALLLGVSMERTQSGWKFMRKVERSGG